jgi:hypothetical protein
MQVLFESRDPDGASQRELAEQRLRFVMRRLSWMLPRVRVQLNDINGPRGGVDKQCRLELNTDRAGTVVITSLARDWRSALDGALMRAARTLLRLLRRGRSQQQRPGRRPLLPQA